jgi:DNA replication protein DnaC
MIEHYTRFPLLVLDDLGYEKPSEWARQVTYYVIDTLYRQTTPVVITTNNSLRELSEIDYRITSRLMEMGIVIELQGEDARLKARS